MASSSRQLPSPSPSDFERQSTPTFDQQPTSKGANMLKIHNLLNPATLKDHTSRNTDSVSPPPTPESTQTSSGPLMSRTGSPFDTSSTKRQKLAKGVTARKHDETKVEVNYPPYECTETAICLSPADQQQLARQHKLFQITPAGNEEHGGMIINNTRHIPYSSDKKSFTGKTGKDGFNVFSYKFHVPNEQVERDVMWDYENGLVRVTPFFKACGHSKTIPAKAINTNPGLKELSYSITGGALAAQGYWMPYECARELCSTFCYDIRWAMTPIFGPSFIHDCLEKNHPGFCKFKICPQTVHNAALQEESWRASTPSTSYTADKREIPRSVPDGVAETERHRRAARPTFRHGSPFASDSDSTRSVGTKSPEISPKSSYSSPVWTSINRRQLPATPQNTPVGSLSKPLLDQSYHFLWRPATTGNDVRRKSQSSCDKTSAEKYSKCTTNKRRRSTYKKEDPDADYVDSQSGYDAEVSESESDDIENYVSTSGSKKRARCDDVNHPSTTVSTISKTDGVPKSRKYHAADYKAARWLLNLSMRDAELATGPNGQVELSGKRKANMV